MFHINNFYLSVHDMCTIDRGTQYRLLGGELCQIQGWQQHGDGLNHVVKTV